MNAKLKTRNLRANRGWACRTRLMTAMRYSITPWEGRRSHEV